MVVKEINCIPQSVAIATVSVQGYRVNFGQPQFWYGFISAFHIPRENTCPLTLSFFFFFSLSLFFCFFITLSKLFYILSISL